MGSQGGVHWPGSALILRGTLRVVIGDDGSKEMRNQHSTDCQKPSSSVSLPNRSPCQPQDGMPSW